MCGITACLSYHEHGKQTNGVSKNASLEEEVEQSLELVKHRGPDARGQWISPDGRVALGHVRLSIIDLSPEGNQPFHDSEDDIHAVVNGELYGYEEYRKQLSEEYNFRGKSDCEIVIALYKHYGLSFLSHLRGEFALVLYDSRRELLFSARDRYGIKSLYYTIVDSRLLVATEMKSFLAFGWKPTWSIRSLRECGWLIDHRTNFEGVYKILPGHYLSVHNFGAPEHKPYWDLDFPDKRVLESRTEEEMILGVRERLTEAVRLRLRADVPVAVYLSGGLDSSSIAGITAHLIKSQGTRLGNDASQNLSRLSVFTVQFDENSGVNESEVARRTAEWLGVKFHPIYMDEEAIASRFEDSLWYSETPFPDVDGPSKLAMAEKVHSLGIKVVVTGEGADEHFGGYSTYHADAVREPDHSWPPSLFNESKREEVWHKLMRSEDMFSSWTPKGEVNKDATDRMLNSTRQAARLRGLDFLKFSPWTDAYVTRELETAIVESWDGKVRDSIANKWHPLHTAEYTWTKTAFPNIILRYCGDNIDMVHQVESRTPFLDHYVTEYANGIPPSLKMKYDPIKDSFREKHILREAVKPFITNEVFTRRKQPFLGPTTGYKISGPFHKMLSRIVTKENVERLGFADWEPYTKLMDKAFREKDGAAMRAIMAIAQYVILGQRFGVKKAEPESRSNSHVDGNVNGHKG